MKRRNFLLYSLLFAVGCSAANNNNNSPEVALPETLTFSVTDVEGIEELEKDYEPFRAALAEVLEINVEFFPVKGYFGAASALRSGELDLVWAGPSEYVTINARSQAKPLIVLNRPEYYTVIAVRKNSNISTLEDLKGKRIDMWKVGSNTAHLGGVKLLLDAGLDPQSDFESLMSGTDELEPLISQKADAWSRPIHKYKKAIENAGVSEEDYPIIAQGKNFPGDVFVVNSQFTPEMIEVMRSRLLENSEQLLQGIEETESLANKFQGASFAAADDADYDMIREVYRAIGQDDYL